MTNTDEPKLTNELGAWLEEQKLEMVRAVSNPDRVAARWDADQLLVQMIGRLAIGHPQEQQILAVLAVWSSNTKERQPKPIRD